MYDLMPDLVICKFRKVWSYMTPNVLLRPGVIKKQTNKQTNKQKTCSKHPLEIHTGQNMPMGWL